MSLILREFTMNSHSLSRIQFKFTIFYQTTRFDLYWTRLTRAWPLMALINLEKYQIWIPGKILSPNICILLPFRLLRPIRPKFDDLTQVWPLVTFIRKNFDFRPKSSRSRHLKCLFTCCFNKIFKAYICILVQGWGTGPNKCWGVFSGLFDNTLVHY